MSISQPCAGEKKVCRTISNENVIWMAGSVAPVVVWVDVSSGVEARVYFRAAAGRRFVIRRVSLPSGVGPLAAEEIAQVIQSVRRALASDSAWALSLAEARTALSASAGERRIGGL